MNIVRFAACAASCLAVLGVGAATAQSTSATPNYGTLDLAAGFSNDPRAISLQAGGSLNAAQVFDNCTGFITDAPDVRLNYTAGSLPLIISVSSAADTTLVVNAPDGQWYCDDDGGVNGSNPSLRFNSPLSGRFEIWVGTYSAGQAQASQLYISEISSQ